MAGLPKALVRATGTVAAVNAAVPAGKRWIITNVILTNSGSAVAAATVSLGGFVLIPSAQIGIAGIFTLDCAQVVEAGQNVTYSATVASTIQVHISGVEMDV